MSLKWKSRHICAPGENGCGWRPGAAWWDLVAPKSPNGPDQDGWGKDGWGYFIVAKIYKLAERIPPQVEFLAVSFGCCWKKSERGFDRAWFPTFKECATLEEAMDYCEWDLRERGILPV